MPDDQQPAPLNAPLSPAEAEEAQRVTGLDLDELERLCEQATPGPWETFATDSRYPIYVHIRGEEFYHVAIMDSQGYKQGIADAAFVAVSRTAVPAMIKALRAAERERDMLREALAAAKIPHLRVEGDPWFSCSVAHVEDSDDPDASSCFRCDGKPCNRVHCDCGADKHNALIDAALAGPERTTPGGES